jgi:hypothetical protein
LDRPASATPRLERRIEAWLKKTFGVEVEFAVDEALAKLDRLRGADPNRGPPRGSGPRRALERFACMWSDFFCNPGS